MARSVLWMLDHPAEAAAMGVNGRERVRSHFSVDVMCEALDSLYSDLLGQAVPDPLPASPDRVRRPVSSDRRSRVTQPHACSSRLRRPGSQ